MILNIFNMSLLEQDSTKKRWVEIAIELDKSNSKEYKIEKIHDSEIYVKELNTGYHLLGLHYLVSWKDYSKKENTWKSVLVMLQLCKLISTFYRDYLKKPTVTSLSINSAFTNGKAYSQAYNQSGGFKY